MSVSVSDRRAAMTFTLLRAGSGLPPELLTGSPRAPAIEVPTRLEGRQRPTPARSRSLQRRPRESTNSAASSSRRSRSSSRSVSAPQKKARGRRHHDEPGRCCPPVDSATTISMSIPLKARCSSRLLRLSLPWCFNQVESPWRFSGFLHGVSLSTSPRFESLERMLLTLA